MKERREEKEGQIKELRAKGTTKWNNEGLFKEMKLRFKGSHRPLPDRVKNQWGELTQGETATLERYRKCMMDKTVISAKEGTIAPENQAVVKETIRRWKYAMEEATGQESESPTREDVINGMRRLTKREPQAGMVSRAMYTETWEPLCSGCSKEYWK